MYAMILLSASPSRLFIDLSKLDIRKSIHGLVAGGGGGCIILECYVMDAQNLIYM